MNKLPIVLTFLFLSSEIVCGQDPDPAHISVLLESIATVEDSYRGSDGKTVIYIQDAHAFSEAQLHIADIISAVSKKSYVDFVGIEGAAGDVSITPFRNFPVADARDYVALEYLKKGLFSGSEYLSMSANREIPLIGMEDQTLFASTYERYKAALADKDLMSEALQQIIDTIDRLKPQVYSESLQLFDQYSHQYRSGSIDIITYIEYVKKFAGYKHIDLSQFAELRRLTQLMASSYAVSFEAAAAQRNDVKNRIQQQLRSLPVERGMVNMIDTILARKQQSLSEGEYLEFLMDFAERLDLTIPHRSAVNALIRYEQLEGTLNYSALDRELELVVWQIRRALAVSEEEAQLLNCEYYCALVKKLITVSMVRDEAQLFLAYDSDQWSACIAVLTQLSDKMGIEFPRKVAYSLGEGITRCSRFYADSIKRDTVFVNNMLLKMNTDSTAVLVAGGFHKAGILKQLQERHISYICVQPCITATTPDINHDLKMSGTLLEASTITVSLLYQDIFSNYPKLLSRFTDRAVQTTIDMMLEGRLSAQGIIDHIYDTYELMPPSSQYAEQYRTAIDQLAQRLQAVAAEGQQDRADMARYLAGRISADVLSRARERQAIELAPPSSNLAVSVIVPVYNELGNGNIFNLLESFANQDADLSSFELILIINNSYDATQSKTEGYLDNQKALELGRYIADGSDALLPAWFEELSDYARGVVSDVKRKGLSVHFLDRSTRGLPGVIEAAKIRIGSIRNIGIYRAIDRFDTVGRDGFIANLDADTVVPTNYISSLISLSKHDNVEVVYANLAYRPAMGNEFLFKTHFIESLMQLTWQFPNTLLDIAPSDVGTVRIIARSSLFHRRQGFPEVTTGEDVLFSRLTRRLSKGIVTTSDITVETQDRLRESGGFDSGIRYQHSQQMSPDQFMMQRGTERVASMRIAFLQKDLQSRRINGRLLSEDELIEVLDFYNIQLAAADPGLAAFRENGSTVELMRRLEEQNSYITATMHENVMDFVDNVLKRSISPQEYDIFMQMLNDEIARHNRDIEQLRTELRKIFDVIQNHPQLATLTVSDVSALIEAQTSHPILRMLGSDQWFAQKLLALREQVSKEMYFQTLSYELRDWVSAIDDAPRNVFRKALVYEQVFMRFFRRAVHSERQYPSFHNYLTRVTGHDYVIIDDDPYRAEPKDYLQEPTIPDRAVEVSL